MIRIIIIRLDQSDQSNISKFSLSVYLSELKFSERQTIWKQCMQLQAFRDWILEKFCKAMLLMFQWKIQKLDLA